MTASLPPTDQLPAAVREGLERLAADAVGPFGRTPLSWLVADHLPLFEELRRLKASWMQINGLLAANGIGRAGGPFPAAVLRATYARAAATAAARGTAKRNRTKRSEMNRDEMQRDETKRDEAKRNGAQLNEKNPKKTGGDLPKRKVMDADAAPSGQNSEPDRPTTAADGLARRAALIHKPLRTR
jgi:hypothetical protein